MSSARMTNTISSASHQSTTSASAAAIVAKANAGRVEADDGRRDPQPRTCAEQAGLLLHLESGELLLELRERPRVRDHPSGGGADSPGRGRLGAHAGQLIR